MCPSRRFTQTGLSVVIPVATGDPGARRHCGGEGFDAGDELRRRLRVAQLYGSEVQSPDEKMDVGIDETRRDGSPVRIDQFRIGRCELSDFARRPDRDDAVPRNPDGFGRWSRGITSPDRAVDDRDRERLLVGAIGHARRTSDESAVSGERDDRGQAAPIRSRASEDGHADEVIRRLVIGATKERTIEPVPQLHFIRVTARSEQASSNSVPANTAGWNYQLRER
jgi:hypothetical protein